MQFLVNIYDKTLKWSGHKHAPYYLAGVSFLDASILMAPPYFMLVPMVLARPTRAFNYALIATIASIFGGMIGYALGYFVFKPLALPILNFFGWTHAYESVLPLFQEHGFWAVLIGGFMPIPYKVVAIAVGFMQLPIPAFIAGTVIGKGIKFYIIALLIKLGGVRMEQAIRAMIERAGLFMLCIAAAVVGLKTVGVF